MPPSLSLSRARKNRQLQSNPLDGLAVGLGYGRLAALVGPWEVSDGDDEEGVAVGC